MFIGGRRHFLKTASGLLVSIPFLPSMAESQQDRKILRFISARSPQGTYKENIRPSLQGLSGTPITGDAKSYDISRIAGPLSSTFGSEFNSLKSKINFYQGLDSMVTASGHNHSTFLCAYQKCTNADSSELSLSEAPAGKEYIMPPKPSIDQLIAAYAYAQPLPVHNVVMSQFEYAGESFSYSYALSGSRVVRVRGPWDPAVHFSKFFKASGQESSAAAVKANRRKLIVDQVLSSYRAFTNQRSMAAVDKQSLDQHMESLFSLQQRLISTATLSCDDPGIVIDKNKFSVANQSLSRAELIEPLYKLVMDIAVAAMRCDALRVFNFCMYGAGSDGVGGGPHGFHHMEKTEENKRIYGTGYDVWYGKMLAYLANQLNTFKDADGTSMLDNSLVLYGKEMSDEGPNHGTSDMLVATIGGLGGKIETGQLIDYNRATIKNQPYGTDTQGRSYNQLLTSIMQGGFGLTPNQFETNGDFGERVTTIWRNTPIVEKGILLPGMFA